MRIRHFVILLLCALVVGCSDDTGATDLQRDSGIVSDLGFDQNASQDTRVDSEFVADVADAADAAGRIDAAALPECPPLGVAPDTVVTPQPGELYYEQFGLGGFALGESAIVVAADGSVVLIDVGNDSHADDIADRLDALGLDAIEHVIVTHFHADHGDGIEEVVDDNGLTGRLVHRGLTDLTEAANSSTFDETGRVARAVPGRDLPLCPTTDCDGLDETLRLGESTVRFVGANATMADERFVDLVGPLDSVDGNGENARSVVGTVEHGPFRLLFSGDLTGGGSDTDDVETFYAERIGAVSDIDERGVDVLHAGHHGRNTSTNARWVARLLPADARPRNVVMGISTAHLRSPHREVLDNLDGALQGGRIWTTRVATGGVGSPEMVDADGGSIIIATRNGGANYVVQAIDRSGDLVAPSQIFHSVRSCTP